MFELKNILPNGPNTIHSLIKFANIAFIILSTNFFLFVMRTQSLNVKYQYWREYKIPVELLEKKKTGMAGNIQLSLSLPRFVTHTITIACQSISFRLFELPISPPLSIYVFIKKHAYHKG